MGACPPFIVGTPSVGATGTTVAPAIPAHKPGWLICLLGTTRSTTAWSPNNGFAVKQQSNGTNLSVGLIWKIAAVAGETCTITQGSDDYVWTAIVIPYHGVQVDADILIGTAATATSATANPPNVSYGSTIDALVLALTGLTFTNAADAVTAGPSGYREAVLTKSASSTTSIGHGLAMLDTPQRSSEDPGTFANTSRVWRAQTYVIPAASYITWDEQFLGSNGDPWPQGKWASSSLGTAGTTDQQSGQGRHITGGSAIGNFHDGQRELASYPHSDFHMRGAFQFTNSEMQMSIHPRGTGFWGGGYAPTDGFDIVFYNGSDIIAFYDEIAGTGTSRAAPAFAFADATLYRFALEQIGATTAGRTRVKVWTGTEPNGGWQIDQAMVAATASSGTGIGVRTLNAVGSLARTGVWDELQFIDLVTPPPPRTRLIVPNHALIRATTW